MLKFLLVVCLIFSCQNDVNSQNTKSRSEYEGRFILSDDLVLNIYKEDGFIKMKPTFWNGSKILDSIDVDHFASRLHPKMTYKYLRDKSGKIIALEAFGHKELNGKADKLAEGNYKAVEYLFANNAVAGIAKLNEDSNNITEKRILKIGFKLISRFPKKASTAFDFLKAYENRFSNSIDLKHLLGLAALRQNKRDIALDYFEAAKRINPSNKMSISVSQILKAKQFVSPFKEAAWKVPFALKELFKKPSKDEIEAVYRDFKTRDLSVKNYNVIYETIKKLQGCEYNLKVIEHNIYGTKHIGVILVPRNANVGESPVLVDIRGVNPAYSPIDIEEFDSPYLLKDNKKNVIIAIPALRGNTLIVNGKNYSSAGKANDAWDGATDDAIAFLNVVLKKTPEANKQKVTVFGKSRGGTVAMLFAQRDKRVKAIAAWAGPAEWFSTTMGTFGFTLQEQVQWALWEKWTIGTGWGSASQYIDYFIPEVRENKHVDLKKARHKILASSALYFVKDFPATQLHYGKQDGAVPITNAEVIENEVTRLNLTNIELFMHEAGHDQPYPKAYEETAMFLSRYY